MNEPLPAAVEAEQSRLESLVSLVWGTEDQHYSHKCGCDNCTQTREFLSPADLQFIDHVSKEVVNNEPRREANSAQS